MTYNSKLNLGTWIFYIFWWHKIRSMKIRSRLLSILLNTWYQYEFYNEIEYVLHFHQSILVQLRDSYWTRTSYFYKKLIGFEYNEQEKKISELIVIVHHLVHYTCICAIICPNFFLFSSSHLLLVLQQWFISYLLDHLV